MNFGTCMRVYQGG